MVHANRLQLWRIFRDSRALKTVVVAAGLLAWKPRLIAAEVFLFRIGLYTMITIIYKPEGLYDLW